MRDGVGVPAREETWCTGLHPAQVRGLGEEVVSALPFPRSAQTWGALRSALHGDVRGAPAPRALFSLERTLAN